jgi:hypothetical protein
MLEPRQPTWDHMTCGALVPSQQGCRIWSRRTCDSAEDHLSRKASSGTIGHVATLEPTLGGRRGPELYDTWQHQSLP